MLATSETERDHDVRAWPLPMPLTDMPLANGAPCVTLDGTTAAPLLASVRMAGHDTRWRFGDKLVSLYVRPMPDELDCAAVQHG